MSSDLLTRKQPIALDADAIDEMKKREESQAALIFALLIGAFAALGIFLMAHGTQNGAPLHVSDCATVEAKSARLACFDQLARNIDMPFKGAPPARLDGER